MPSVSNFLEFIKLSQSITDFDALFQICANQELFSTIMTTKHRYKPWKILDKKPAPQSIFKALIAVAVRDPTAKLNSTLSSALVMVVGGDWRSNYRIRVPFSTEFCSFSAVGKVSESIFIRHSSSAHTHSVFPSDVAENQYTWHICIELQVLHGMVFVIFHSQHKLKDETWWFDLVMGKNSVTVVVCFKWNWISICLYP